MFKCFIYVIAKNINEMKIVFILFGVIRTKQSSLPPSLKLNIINYEFVFTRVFLQKNNRMLAYLGIRTFDLTLWSPTLARYSDSIMDIIVYS